MKHHSAKTNGTTEEAMRQALEKDDPLLPTTVNRTKIPKQGLWSLKGQISNNIPFLYVRSCPSSHCFFNSLSSQIFQVI